MIRIVVMTTPLSNSGSRRTSRKHQLLLQGVSHRVVDAANGVLDFALGLVGFAVALQFCVAKRLADRCFRSAFDFLDRTGDSVLVHGCSPCVLRRHVTALNLSHSCLSSKR